MNKRNEMISIINDLYDELENKKYKLTELKMKIDIIENSKDEENIKTLKLLEFAKDELFNRCIMQYHAVFNSYDNKFYTIKEYFNNCVINIPDFLSKEDIREMIWTRFEEFYNQKIEQYKERNNENKDV